MKKLCLFIVFATLSITPLLSQDTTETLFGEDLRIGGFGGPIFEFGPIANDFGPLAGGGGGVILNDFFLGGYGMGSAFVQPDNLFRDEKVVFGHGGIWLGYSYEPYKLAHVYVDAKIGWGGYHLDSDDDDDFNFERDVDNVFIFQPGAGVELNLLKWFKIVGALHYRYVDGVSPNYFPNISLTNNDFREYSVSLTLRFGGFGYDN